MPPIDVATYVAPRAGLDGPAGPVSIQNRLKWVQGETTLVAGAGAEVLSAEQAADLRSDPLIIVQKIVAGAGAQGFVTATWTEGTRTLAFASSAATDVGTVRWGLLQWA